MCEKEEKNKNFLWKLKSLDKTYEFFV